MRWLDIEAILSAKSDDSSVSYGDPGSFDTLKVRTHLTASDVAKDCCNIVRLARQIWQSPAPDVRNDDCGGDEDQDTERCSCTKHKLAMGLAFAGWHASHGDNQELTKQYA